MSQPRIVSDEELDLLAEGELSREERADLFRRLDQQPQTWKSCALALLESQSLRATLRASLPEHGRSPSAHPLNLISLSQPESSRPGRNLLSSHRLWSSGMVILTLIAASLGGYSLGRLKPETKRSEPSVVEKVPPQPSRVPPVEDPFQTVTRSTLNWLNVGDEELLAVVRLDEGPEARYVPIVASPKLADRLRQIPQTPLSPQRIQQANQRGWNVLQHPQLIAIDRPAAETEVVPVQMVRYKFAGRDAM